MCGVINVWWQCDNITVLYDVTYIEDIVTQSLYCVMSHMFEDIVTQLHVLYYVMSQMFDDSLTQ